MKRLKQFKMEERPGEHKLRERAELLKEAMWCRLRHVDILTGDIFVHNRAMPETTTTEMRAFVYMEKRCSHTWEEVEDALEQHFGFRPELKNVKL